MTEFALYLMSASVVVWVGLVFDRTIARHQARSPLATTRARSRSFVPHARPILRARYMAHKEDN